MKNNYKIDAEIINDVENGKIVAEDSKSAKVSMVTALGKAGIKTGFDKYKNMTLAELKTEKETIDNRIDEIKANNTETKYDNELKKQSELQNQEAEMSFNLAEAEVYENQEDIDKIKADQEKLRQEVNENEQNIINYENQLDAENKELKSLNKEKLKIDKEIVKKEEEENFEKELSASVQQIMDEANATKTPINVEINTETAEVSNQENQTVTPSVQISSSNQTNNDKDQLDLLSIKLVDSKKQVELINQQQDQFMKATAGIFSAIATSNASVIENQNKSIEILKAEIIKLRKENMDLKNNHNLEVQRLKNEHDLKVQSLNGDISELKGKLEAETTEKENLSQELASEKMKNKNLGEELEKAKQFASKVNSQFQQFKDIMMGSEMNAASMEENGFTKQK